MPENKNDLLIQIVERYQYHKNFKTDNPITAEIKEKICDLELHEMWTITQVLK